MNHIVKTVVLAVPLAITFVDSVGYVARVDGKIDQKELTMAFKLSD